MQLYFHIFVADAFADCETEWTASGFAPKSKLSFSFVSRIIPVVSLTRASSSSALMDERYRADFAVISVFQPDSIAAAQSPEITSGLRRRICIAPHAAAIVSAVGLEAEDPVVVDGDDGGASL